MTKVIIAKENRIIKKVKGSIFKSSAHYTYDGLYADVDINNVTANELLDKLKDADIHWNNCANLSASLNFDPSAYYIYSLTADKDQWVIIDKSDNIKDMDNIA